MIDEKKRNGNSPLENWLIETINDEQLQRLLSKRKTENKMKFLIAAEKMRSYTTSWKLDELQIRERLESKGKNISGIR